MKEDKQGWAVCVGSSSHCQQPLSPALQTDCEALPTDHRSDNRAWKMGLLGWRNWKATYLELGTWIKLGLVNTHCTKPLWEWARIFAMQGLSTELWHLNDTIYPVR